MAGDKECIHHPSGDIKEADGHLRLELSGEAEGGEGTDSYELSGRGQGSCP